MSELESLGEELNQLKRQLQDAQKAVADTSLTQCVQKGLVRSLHPINLRQRRIMRGHLAKVYAIDWLKPSNPNPSGKQLYQVVSASQDGKLIIWDALSTNKLRAISLRCSWVMTCAYAPSGKFVACGGLENDCTVYSVDSRNILCSMKKQLHGHLGYISDCQFLNDHQILTSSGDSSCCLWDIENGLQLLSFRGHSKDVIGICLLPQAQVFLSGSCDRTAKLWDIRAGGKPQQTFYGHEGDVNGVAHFPNSEFAFATASDDTTCRLFDLRADQQIAVYGHEGVCSGVTSVDFTKSGRIIIGGYDNYQIHLWDTLLQTRVSAVIPAHGGRISCLGMSPDGTVLCTGSWDSYLKIWY